MTDAQPESQKLGLLARLVLICLVVLAAAGVIWYGVTISTIQRLWRQLIERPYGPMAFPFILQPVMAAIAAFFHGRKDARIGRTSYFWAMVRNGKERVERLREALNATARIILLGLIMDAIYQIIVFRRFYPVEAAIIAVLLWCVPDLVFRGLVPLLLRIGRDGASAHRA